MYAVMMDCKNLEIFIYDVDIHNFEELYEFRRTYNNPDNYASPLLYPDYITALETVSETVKRRNWTYNTDRNIIMR